MATETTTRARLGWPLRIVLILSLGLNLLIVGLVIGFLTIGKGERRVPPPRDAAAPYTRSLEPDQQRALLRTMRGEYEGKRFRPGDLVKEYRQAVSLLRADPFDASSFEALLVEQAGRAQERLSTGQRALARHVADMSSDDRRAYADRLEAELNRLGEKKREWKPHK
jgi:uncharacterized membrane protein